MIKNYLTTAIRNLRKNKVFSLVNIAGLSVGLAVFILIMLWVKNEMSYDGFHQDKERIAMVMTNRSIGNKEIQTFPAVPSLLANAMKKDLPVVEYAATASWGDMRMLTYGQKNFIEYGLYVSPDFLKVFSFPLIKGDAGKVLLEPNTILISEKTAKKYFGNEDPVGKLINGEKTQPYKIEGVIKAVPANATLTFDFLMPVKDYINQTMGGNETWEFGNMKTFVKLKDGVNRSAFDISLKKFLNRYTDKQPNSELSLFYLKDWYLKMDFKNGKYGGSGRIEYVKLFTIIAIFILLLACINFMNLSTARATQRSKEVGIRKVIGAQKKSLIAQFIGESVLVSVIAGAIAVVLVSLVLPSFNSLLRKEIAIDYSNTGNIFAFVSILLITGILAGSYPALVLSAFKPVKVLKGAVDNTAANTAGVRKGLVITQFAVSVILIVGTLIVSRQINFIKNKNLGYNKENLIWFSSNIESNKQETAIQEFLKVPGVTHAAQASMTFVMPYNRGSEVSWTGKTEGQEVFFSFVAGGYDIIKTMGIELKEGKDFSGHMPADSASAILNEEAVRQMGLKDPVGKTIETNGGKFTIAGVAKDFHFESMHNPVAPAIIMCKPEWTWLYYVRTNGTNTAQVIKEIENVYSKMAPGFVFDYNFQDKEYERLYRSEQQTGTLVNWFSFFAIFISCLGLLGLTIFTVERKTKEIGIRKVLGASAAGIMYLLSKDFFKLVLIAVLIAFPLAWWAMNKWLSSYAYKTDIGVGVFAIALGLIVLLTLITVSFQSVKAAVANPVKSLRTE